MSDSTQPPATPEGEATAADHALAVALLATCLETPESRYVKPHFVKMIAEFRQAAVEAKTKELREDKERITEHDLMITNALNDLSAKRNAAESSLLLSEQRVRALEGALEYALPLLDIVADLEVEEQNGPCAANRAFAAKELIRAGLSKGPADKGEGRT